MVGDLKERSRLSGIVGQNTDGVLSFPTKQTQHGVLLIVIHHREGVLMSCYGMIAIFAHMVVSDYLFSILIFCGFVADQHKVPLMALGTAHVVNKVGAILQTGVPPIWIFFLDAAGTHNPLAFLKYFV